MRTLPGPIAAMIVAVLLPATWAVPALTAARSASAIPAGALDSQDEFDKAAEQQENLAAKTPNNPEAWYKLAAYYSEKAKAATLPITSVRKYLIRGSEVNERALNMAPQYLEALRLKSVLLRQRAVYENKPSVRKRLLAEAAVYSASAEEMAALSRKSQLNSK